jgi:hypothetical protein
MGDILVTVPGAGLEFYLEGLSTDLDATVIKNSESFWADAAYTLGVRAVGRGREGRLDLWMEGHFVGMRPHTHHQLRDGLTVDRRVFGHPLGPLARSLQVGSSRHVGGIQRGRLGLPARWSLLDPLGGQSG